MRNIVKSTVLAIAVAGGIGASAPPASAIIVKAPPGSGPFSGLTASGTSATLDFSSGAMTVFCSSVALTGISGSGIVSYMTHALALGGCVAAPLSCETDVTTPGTWTLTHMYFRSPGFELVGRTGSAITIALNDPPCGFTPADCTITIPTATSLSGLSPTITNVGTTVRLAGTFIGVPWTSSTPGCGIGSSGTASLRLFGPSGIVVNGINVV